MRVARVLTRLNLGGPARQVLASDPELLARGHDVRVLCGTPEPGEGDLADALAHAGVEVRRIPGLVRGIGPRALLAGRGARRALEAELRDFAPDIVHTHASKAGALGRAAARPAVPGAARVHTFHGHVLEGYFAAPLSLALQELERRAARRTDRVVAVSEATRADLARLGVAPRDAIEVSPPGLDLGALLALDADRRGGCPFRRAHAIPPDEPLVGVLGRLAPVKRPRLALRIFARVAASEFPRAHVVFAGDGAERGGLEADVAALPPSLAGRVHLVGALSDVVPFHRAIDVLLGTSSSEGMPVAMIEAAAAARPVVSTAVGGVPELVRPGVTGLLAAEEEGLVAALAALLGDPDQRASLGARARRIARERHSAAALCDRLLGIYERALASRARAGDTPPA
ncbi:MAG: glycosyltransferase family 4 protein [Planctomycetota bacterium]